MPQRATLPREPEPAWRPGGRRPYLTREILIGRLLDWAATHEGRPPAAKDWAESPDWPSVGSVTRYFGSWAAGLRAAGMEPLRMLDGGAPRATVGPCLNCGQETEPRQAAKGYCKTCSAYYRRTGKPWHPAALYEGRQGQRAAKEDRWRCAIGLRALGMTNPEIAAEMGLTRAAVVHLLNRARAAGWDVPDRTPFCEWTNRDESNPWRIVLRADPCAYCGAPSQHIDHIHPEARGGSSDNDNLTGACASCNVHKHATPLLLFLLRQRAPAGQTRAAS